MTVSCILLAGGIGSRMKSETPKQFLPLLDRPIIHYSIELLQNVPNLQELVIVADEKWHHLLPKEVSRAPAGIRRQDSLQNGLKALKKPADVILVHDAARPFFSPDLVEQVIQGATLFGACAPAIAIKGTVKTKNRDDFVIKTLNRNQLIETQTPQAIKYALLIEGMEWIQSKGITVTDDVSIVEHFGHPVKLIAGNERNFKITTPFDLQVAANVLLTPCPA